MAVPLGSKSKSNLGRSFSVLVYEVQISNKALRGLVSVPVKIKGSMSLALDQLSQNPLPYNVQAIQGQVNLYRLRFGDYRLVYEIDELARIVLVLLVGHRSAIYKKLP